MGKVNISKIMKITESSEMPPENQYKTRKQLMSFADLSQSREIERIITILPDGKVLEITPDENSKIRVSSNEEVSQQNKTDTIE